MEAFYSVPIRLDRGCGRRQGEEYWARCLQYEITDITFVNIKYDLYQYFLGLTPSSKVRKMKNTFQVFIQLL